MPVTAKGLEGIIANSTRLSDVIGDKGKLNYSGYDIDELAGKVSFKEVLYLLWKGKLPNRQEVEQFMKQLRAERELPGGVIDFIKGAPKTAGPMDVMRTAVSMLGLYDPEMDKEATREINERRARSITAKIGIIAAYFHRARNGKSLPPVRDDLTEAEHFLYLINGEPQPKEAADTLDVAFVLSDIRSERAGRFRPLHPERFLVAMPNEHSLARLRAVRVEHLAREPVVLFPRALDPAVHDHLVVDVCGRAGVSLSVMLEATTLESSLGAVADGLGLAFTAESVVDLITVRGITFRPLAATVPALQVGVAWRRDATSKAVQRFLVIVDELARGLRFPNRDGRADRHNGHRHNGHRHNGHRQGAARVTSS